jgi:Protein of unknown function (DUF3085)
MTTLIFKNEKLQKLLKITEQAATFRATYAEAIKAYQKDTNKKYDGAASLDRYYLHNAPMLWLVKDEGIYLMSSAKLEEFPEDKSHICYAEGFAPDASDSYEKCKKVVGGDDFVESFPFNDQLRKGIKKGADIHIHVSAQTIIVHLVISQ